MSSEELLYFWHQLPDHSGLPSAPLFECTESCEGLLEPGGFTWVRMQKVIFHALKIPHATLRQFKKKNIANIIIKYNI